ncbi:hypothetical protein [Borreliella turdi]|uniref:hypothetical protein n=1 Tax=Borreliella turdi TaxID=57863 RepID=UPI003AF05048
MKKFKKKEIISKIIIEKFNIKLHRAKEYKSQKEQDKFLMPSIIKLNKYKKNLEI